MTKEIKQRKDDKKKGNWAPKERKGKKQEKKLHKDDNRIDETFVQ